MKLSSKTVLCFSIVFLLTLSDVSFASESSAFGDIGHQAKDPSPQEKAAAAITNQLVTQYRDEHGNISYPDLYNALGALSGFGCQMAIRDGFIKTGKISEEKAFTVIQTKNGKHYFFGNFLNMCLANPTKDQISVWSIVSGAAQLSGSKNLPDLKDIATYTVKTVGSENYGAPRIPSRYHVKQMPIDVLKTDWPSMHKLLVNNNVDPMYWGWTFANAAQNVILKDKDKFDAGTAATIVMEAAWPMSKIDPKDIDASNSKQQ